MKRVTIIIHSINDSQYNAYIDNQDNASIDNQDTIICVY